MLDVIIVGSGPYGISLAAHAQAAGLDYKLLGYPMDLWKNQMPRNMFIRTPYEFVAFSDPKDEFTLIRFAADTGTKLSNPLPRTTFVNYASWFAERSGIEFTPGLVTSLVHNEESFTVMTETGKTLHARTVIIATGVEHYKYIPEVFRNLPARLVSHTSGYTNFQAFNGQRVAVVGSGQSAWEAAGLLYLEHADVELIYRRESANYAGGPAEEQFLSELGEVFYALPVEEKQQGWGQSSGSVAHFLRPYVEGKVRETGSVSIVNADETTDGKVQLTLSNGHVQVYDHVFSASGFHINTDRVPFFSIPLRQLIEREPGYQQFPKLTEQFQSSVPGLFFAGPLSSHSHGPTFRFILGLKKTASTIVPFIVQHKNLRIGNGDAVDAHSLRRAQ